MSILTIGQDYLDSHPDFKLVGRETDLEKICSVLLRQNSNSIFMTGIEGVGVSDVCLGLQALKRDLNTPSDIFSKRFFWLNTDAFFSNGNTGNLGNDFNRAIAQLKRVHNSVLVIENTKDFIESSRNSGCFHFLNSLSNSIINNEFQAILLSKEEDVEFVTRAYSDLNTLFTFINIEEPVGENLSNMVNNAVKSLCVHHKINVSEDAVRAAIELTNKYQTNSLSKAQPERAVTLIDRALASYRLNSHKTAPVGIEPQQWTDIQARLRSYTSELRDYEEAITEKEHELEQQLKTESKSSTINGNVSEDATSSLLTIDGADTIEVRKIKKDIKVYQQEVDKFKEKFDQLTHMINCHLELTREHIFLAFSAISGISLSKLNQSEIEKIKTLDSYMKSVIYGQDHVTDKVVNGIKVAKLGRKRPGRPVGSYLFYGPSGVGKTEEVIQIAHHLEYPLFRIDMSEYQEKHAVARLIGAPPGYEGFESGGLLTNAARKLPRRCYLFDEIEKAHPDVFDVMLQVLDAGRLTDGLGRVASFEEALIFMTTNKGQIPLLSSEIPFDQAAEQGMQELADIYKPEFLNRFAGRQNIIPFKMLYLDSIEKIVKREFGVLNSAYADRHIQVNIDDQNLKSFCQAVYNPKEGARGLPGYIEANVDPSIVNKFLDESDYSGNVNVTFDIEKKKLNVEFSHSENTLQAA